MSVVVAQAQGAEAIVTADPPRALAALRTISSTTRDALVELRNLLSVVRHGDGADAVVPQPALTDADALAASGRAAGLDLHVTVEGDPAVVPAGVSLSAYRVLQEAITNAAKHAAGSRVDARVSVGEGTVAVHVANGPRARSSAALAGSGAGLVGMQERVEMFGGTFTAGPTGEGGWLLRAMFPW